MRKIYFFRKFYSLIVVTAFISNMLVLVSCEKQSEIDLQENKDLSKYSFSVVNGFLRFESTEALVQVLDGIANINDNERENWENKVGFLSQRRIVNIIINEENRQDSINESIYKDKDIEWDDLLNLHSDAYNNYLSKGVIKVFDKGTIDEYWDYAVFNKGFVDIINEDGLYAIGDTLYQVTENSLKAMKNADFNQAQLLVKATKPDEKNDIIFIHQESALKRTSPGLIVSEWVELGTGKQGDKRINIGIYLSVYQYIVSSKSFYFYHDVYVQCQERNWLRQWKYKDAYIDVYGSWDVMIYESPEYYGNSWSWHGYGNYLKASVNPGTGISAPFQSIFSVRPYDPWNTQEDQYEYAPVWDWYHWTATRGSLTASLDQW